MTLVQGSASKKEDQKTRSIKKTLKDITEGLDSEIQEVLLGNLDRVQGIILLEIQLD